jgi:hypothetical protein
MRGVVRVRRSEWRDYGSMEMVWILMYCLVPDDDKSLVAEKERDQDQKAATMLKQVAFVKD